MNYVFYMSFLFAITFHDATCQINNFKNALMNDLNVTCILVYGADVVEAVNIMDKCMSDELDALYEQRHELNHNEERIALVCQKYLPQTCGKKFIDILRECLPEDVHNTTEEVLHMYFRFFESLCDNDAENYRALLENDCNLIAKSVVDDQMTLCETMFDEGKATIHIKDFFTEENCQSYQDYYNCQKGITGICPELEKAIHGMFDAMAEVSPCNTKE